MADKSQKRPEIAVTPENYQKMAQQYTPKPTILKNSLRAFAVGGIICTIGQLFINLFITLGLARPDASSAATAVMIMIGALLTGLGIYDEIGKFAGAGSIVPVTGFANSIVASAMEFSREGYVMGVGAKLFTVAGPVLVYGITTSVFVGFFYYLLH